jgi:hypothetical protein
VKPLALSRGTIDSPETEIFMEKPNARGPSPARKAERALGKQLNRKPKQPPTLPDGKIQKKPPASRRVTDL